MTNKEQHARVKDRITPEQHGDAPVWCDYTGQGQSSPAEAVYQVALALAEADEDTSPEAVQADCQFYALKPAPLPWATVEDLAAHILERVADRFYDDANGFEWRWTTEQRNTLASHLTPSLAYLASIVNVFVADEGRAIDVSVDFVRDVLKQEAP